MFRWTVLPFTIGVLLGAAALVPASAAGGRTTPLKAERGTERWLALATVSGVGRLEWSCIGGHGRLRFSDLGGPTELVRVWLGLGLYSEARIQPGGALQDSLEHRAQRWRIEPISESLPPVSVFGVKPGDARCAKPSVSHHFLRNPGR
jgi:hypothetical protein